MSDDPGVLRDTLVRFSLEQNNVVAQLNSITVSGDAALKSMAGLDSVINTLPPALPDLAPKIPSTMEKITALTGGFAGMGYSLHNLMGIMDRFEISQLSVENSTLALEDAQARYDEALRKHGANSEEATKAANMLTRAQNNLDKTNLRANASILFMGLSTLEMIPKALDAGKALIGFATSGKLAMLGLNALTWSENINTISTTANTAAKWIQVTATNALTASKTFLTAATARLTLANITSTATMIPATLAALTGAAALGALGVATWSVAIPILAIEAPLWLVVGAVGALVLVVQDLYSYLTGGESVFGGFIDGIIGAFQNIPEFFRSMIRVFQESGKFLADAFLSGMSLGIMNTDRLDAIFGTIGKYLPHSDAEVGPLSDLTGSGMKFMETFTKGAQLAVPSIGGALDGIGSTLFGGGGFGYGNSISISVTVTGNTISGDDKSLGKLAGMTADSIEETMNKILSNQARRAGI